MRESNDTIAKQKYEIKSLKIISKKSFPLILSKHQNQQQLIPDKTKVIQNNLIR